MGELDAGGRGHQAAAGREPGDAPSFWRSQSAFISVSFLGMLQRSGAEGASQVEPLSPSVLPSETQALNLAWGRRRGGQAARPNPNNCWLNRIANNES